MDGRHARIVLGVADDAGPAEIRRAFRARALETHPDHGGRDAAFAELVDAFQVLVSAAPATRAEVLRRTLVAAPAHRPRFDAYDSPRRPAPRRTFADALAAASAQLS